MGLNGKVAIITGGASGIGAKISEVFAENGASVIIADINKELGVKVCKSLKSSSYICNFVPCDITKYNQCEGFIKYCVRTFGKIDIVVNCAGIVLTSSIEQTSLEEWRRVMETNLYGAFFISKFAIPHLKKTKGCIINIASIAGLVGFRGLSAYCASKGGLIALSRSLALELAEYGVRVNCICPGTVDTPFMKQLIEQSKNKEAARAHFEKKTPLKRPATPAEIASLALYLADESQSSYMTGSIITIDGGYTTQ